MRIQFTGLFEKALEFAIKHHKGQSRKGNRMPYYRHPISVAENIEEVKQSKNLELLMTAAVLHDTVEDCPGVTIKLIAKMFGYQVASLVDELTSDPKLVKKMGKTEYLKNKMEHLTSYGLVIKLADRLHNVEDLSSTPPSFRKAYIKETIALLDHLESGVRKLTATHHILLDKIRAVVTK